ncbi:MAG: NAD(P)-binding domain-containing protein [Cryobacterium sp.]|nr:NAD(P)-binding domain-containing protein [Oligoflexia bacterium]
MSTPSLTPSNIAQIGVLGSGQMGGGIAQVAAQSGFKVLLADRDLATAESGKKKIEAGLQKQIEKEKISPAEVKTILAGIQPVSGISDLRDADLVIEAVTENPTLKFELFRKLDEACKATAILATNTSSISITLIAAQTKRPALVVGMHFMNPVPVMKLIEGIRAIQTSDAAFEAVKSVSEKMGKTFISVQDIPGFAVNRILMPMINEAVQVVYEGIASVEDVDTAMKLGTNQPMGPLTLADFIGLDTCLAIMEVLHTGLSDSKYRPSPLLKQMVSAGWFGRKNKKGFYDYANPENPLPMRWGTK